MGNGNRGRIFRLAEIPAYRTVPAARRNPGL